MKKKKGFTLVELLAVIVILAVILIIAMPKISDVIKNSKESSLETTAKLIASQAEKKYTENQVLDNSSTIKCSDVAKISNADYESCNITFDDKGNAKVTIVGKGKFEGLQVVDGTKDSAKASTKKDIVETAAKYFSYEDITVVSNVIVEDVDKCTSYVQSKLHATEEQATTLCTTNRAVGGRTLQQAVSRGYILSSDYETAGLKVETRDGISITGYQIGTVSNVEVKDENKCKSYLQTLGGTEEQATTLCTTNQAVNGLTLQQAVSKGRIPSSDYETAGLKVTYENGGGTDVVIPSQIDGKTVAAIGVGAFTTRGVIPTLTAYNNDYKVGLLSYNSNKKYEIKQLAIDGVTHTAGLGITSVIIPNTITSIGVNAFKGNKLTNVEIPSSITRIGDYAFADNKITLVKFPSTLITLGCSVFYRNPIMEDSSYSFPSNVKVLCIN